MKTEIKPLSDVDYALDVHVPADDLEPRIQEALKKQRAQINLKGFRPGKVPLTVVRKLVGPQVAVQIAEETIGEAYREAVAEVETYDVLGQPRLSELDYDPQKGGDLHAVVKFGVRPLFELAQMEGVPVTKFVRTFGDEDVEADLQRRREMAATLEPAEEGATLAEANVAVVDLQPVSAEGEPTGPAQRGARLELFNPNLREELKNALLGQPSGATFQVDLPHQHGEDEEHAHGHGEPAPAEAEDHVERFRVTVTEILHRTLPEFDAEFVKAQTGGKIESVDDLRADVRRAMEESWERRTREATEAKMVEEFVNAHAFAVPETLVETALDARLDEMRERNEGKLPPGFDVQGYRERMREPAEQQVRWLLVKDRLIHEEGIEVTDADFDAEFARIAGDEMEADLVKGFFARQPEGMDQIADAILNRRVFESLGHRFTVVEKTREDLERERDEREAQEREEREAQERAEREAVEAAATEAAKPKKRGLFGFGRRKEE